MYVYIHICIYVYVYMNDTYSYDINLYDVTLVVCGARLPYPCFLVFNPFLTYPYLDLKFCVRYVCEFVCVCVVCVFVCMHVRACVEKLQKVAWEWHACICPLSCISSIYKLISIHLYIFVYMFIYMCMCVHMLTCMCTHIFFNAYILIHGENLWRIQFTNTICVRACTCIHIHSCKDICSINLGF